jgi:hypothetical protein
MRLFDFDSPSSADPSSMAGEPEASRIVSAGSIVTATGGCFVVLGIKILVENGMKGI